MLADCRPSRLEGDYIFTPVVGATIRRPSRRFSSGACSRHASSSRLALNAASALGLGPEYVNTFFDRRAGASPSRRRSSGECASELVGPPIRRMLGSEPPPACLLPHRPLHRPPQPPPPGRSRAPLPSLVI